MHPSFQKLMMEMQLGFEENDNTPPTFDKVKAKEIFMFVEEEKEKAMKNTKGGMPMMPNPSDMEGTINMIVEHSKVGDRLYEKFGVEEEEFAKAIQYYDLIRDPDIQKHMQKSLQNMGPEAMQMLAQLQGSMGGGMGPGGAAPGGGMPGGGMGF